MRTLMHSFIREGHIRTTLAKAKALRPFMERLITRARVDSPASRRLIRMRLGGSSEIAKLYSDIASKYKERKGGYTRIVKAGSRQSDGASMAIIELVNNV